MRPDSANILIGMGYVLDEDFVADEITPDNVRVTRLSQRVLPSEADIDAAAPAIYAAIAARKAEQQQATIDRAALKTIYQSDLDALQAIRDFSGIVTLTIVGQAVKTLAVVLIHVLKALKAVV